MNLAGSHAHFPEQPWLKVPRWFTAPTLTEWKMDPMDPRNRWPTTGSFVLSQTGGKGAQEWVTAWVPQSLKFEFPKVGGFWVSVLPLGLQEIKLPNIEDDTNEHPKVLARAGRAAWAEASWWCFQHPKAFVHNIKRTEISYRKRAVYLFVSDVI